MISVCYSLELEEFPLSLEDKSIDVSDDSSSLADSFILSALFSKFNFYVFITNVLVPCFG